MQIRQPLRRAIYLVGLLSLLTVACEHPVAFDRTNELDPASDRYIPMPPVIEHGTGALLRIVREEGDVAGDIFTVERSINEGSFEPIGELSRTTNAFVDTARVVATYQYRFRTSRDGNEYVSEASDSVYVGPLLRLPDVVSAEGSLAALGDGYVMNIQQSGSIIQLYNSKEYTWGNPQPTPCSGAYQTFVQLDNKSVLLLFFDEQERTLCVAPFDAVTRRFDQNMHVTVEFVRDPDVYDGIRFGAMQLTSGEVLMLYYQRSWSDMRWMVTGAFFFDPTTGSHQFIEGTHEERFPRSSILSSPLGFEMLDGSILVLSGIYSILLDPYTASWEIVGITALNAPTLFHRRKVIALEEGRVLAVNRWGSYLYEHELQEWRRIQMPVLASATFAGKNTIAAYSTHMGSGVYLIDRTTLERKHYEEAKNQGVRTPDGLIPYIHDSVRVEDGVLVLTSPSNERTYLLRVPLLQENGQ